MNRYRVEHPDEHLEIWVGWNNALQTYFGQVFDDRVPDDEHECVFWVGKQACELPSTGALYEAMLAWVELPGPLLRLVRADKDQGLPRTPLQETMLALVRRVHRAHAAQDCEPDCPLCQVARAEREEASP
jgi:hypothetical protein